MKNTAVVVVHGVGDPRPGDALADLSSALYIESNRELTLGGTEIHHLPDHSRFTTNNLHELFPMVLRRGELNGSAVIFTEVFWGEVSKVAHGVLGLIRGIISLIFGLQAIITGDRQKAMPTGIHGMVTRVGNLGGEILRGPVFAINVLLFFGIVSLVLATLLFSYNADNLADYWPVIGFGSAVTAAFGVWLLRSLRCPEDFEGVVPGSEYRVFGWFCIFAALMWPVVGWLIKANDLELWARAAGIPLLICFTLVALCLLIVVAMHIYVSLFRRRNKDVQRSIGAKTLAFAIQFGLWSGMIPLVWLVGIGLLKKMGFKDVPGDDLVRIFYQNVPAEGLQWILVAVVLSAFIIILLIRKYVQPSQRLIIGWLGHVAIVITALYGCLAAISLINNSTVFNENLSTALSILTAWVPVPESLISWIQANEYRIVTAASLIFASSFVLEGIRAALDIANDIINYLRFNIAFDKRSIGRSGEAFEQLRPVRGKFNEVMRYLSGNEQFDRLVIVAHSQGTIIALDELAHSNFGRERQWLQNMDVRLITMGSPAAHLFQHYFPFAYPAWSNKDYWGELTLRINSWLNLYREDDFVGTTMGMKDSDPLYDVFREVKVAEKGGHTNYWRDRRVIQLIFEEIIRD